MPNGRCAPSTSIASTGADRVSPLSLSRDSDQVTVCLSSPILSRAALTGLAEVLDRLAGDPTPSPVIIASAHPTIFLAGANLGEIAELDPRSCIPYARLGRSVAHRLESHPAPVIAAVHGSCSGGGFDLVVACDVVIASPEATFAHPGVRRGLVTGWGGTGRLSGPLGPGPMRRALLEGAALDTNSMKQLGAVLEIAEDPLAEARATARDLARTHPSRLGDWRRLRGPSFVDRFRAFVVEKL